MESDFYDSKDAILEFFDKINVTKFSCSPSGIYQIHQHVYIIEDLWIPRFRWFVHGDLEITHKDILYVSKMPLAVFGQMKIDVRGLSDFNFYTKVYGKFIVNVAEPFLIQKFPNNCPVIIFSGFIDMSEINMEQIYEYEKNNNSTVYIQDGQQDMYENWLKGKERIDTIRDIINS